MSSHQQRARETEDRLKQYEASFGVLSGIAIKDHRDVFVLQLVDSAKRTHYIKTMRSRDISARRLDPADPVFDPILAAILQIRRLEAEEAFWLAFLSVHFGKHSKYGWNLCRCVYAGANPSSPWTWIRTKHSPDAFGKWIDEQANAILLGPPRRAFGNHRKYESLRASSSRGTPAVLKSYVNWINSAGDHAGLFDDAVTSSGGDPAKAFDRLYREMKCVPSFGRLARFDYLSLIGKLGLSPIEAGSTYLANSTGPIRGARALFGVASNFPKPTLEAMVGVLARSLEITMQDMEDALCNWQKSPAAYVKFRG